jgi:hypothetical protein
MPPILCVLRCWVALMCFCAYAPAQRSESDRSPAAALQETLQLLTDEARESLQTQRLVRTASDFAATSGFNVSAELIVPRLLRSQHSDPFVDAYIRWQLTSFSAVNLPELNRRHFDKLLSDLPGLMENPRADRNLIDALAKAAAAGRLSAVQQAALSAQLNNLTERSSRTESLNLPALGFRAWLTKQLSTSANSSQILLAGLEKAAALVETGWSVDQAKAALDKAFAAAGHDPAFTDADRRRVIDKAAALVGKRRMLVMGAAMRNDSLAAEYADTAIYDFDVRRWEISLRRD